jgi:hypothetical protein
LMHLAQNGTHIIDFSNLFFVLKILFGSKKS